MSRSQNLTIAPEVRNFVNLAQETLNLRYQREDRRRPEQQGTSVSTCPICLINTYFTIETNCGHKFCGKSFERKNSILKKLILKLKLSVCWNIGEHAGIAIQIVV